MASKSFLAAIKRQFVDITYCQHVATIELTLAAFVGETIRVLWSPEIRLRICNSMRIGVVSADHRIPTKVLLYAHLESMVVGVKTRRKHVDCVVTQKRA